MAVDIPLEFAPLWLAMPDMTKWNALKLRSSSSLKWCVKKGMIDECILYTLKILKAIPLCNRVKARRIWHAARTACFCDHFGSVTGPAQLHLKLMSESFKVLRVGGHKGQRIHTLQLCGCIMMHFHVRSEHIDTHGSQQGEQDKTSKQKNSTL